MFGSLSTFLTRSAVIVAAGLIVAGGIAAPSSGTPSYAQVYPTTTQTPIPTFTPVGGASSSGVIYFTPGTTPTGTLVGAGPAPGMATTPTATPTAAAPANQVTGTIIGLDTISSPMVAQVRTTSGDVMVNIVNSAILPGLGLGVDVTFTGSFASSGTLHANALKHNTIYPTATATPYNYTAGTTYDYDNYDYDYDNYDYDYDNYDDSSYRPFCTYDEDIELDPDDTTATLNTTHQIRVEVSGPMCPGYRLMVKIRSGSANAAATISPSDITLDSQNRAVFSYTGTVAGTDTIDIWVDAMQDGVLSSGEAEVTHSLTWRSGGSNNSPTATATPSPTRTPTRTPTP